MTIIDLHCDTLTGMQHSADGNADTLNDTRQMLSLSTIPDKVQWAQFFAVFIPDEVRGSNAIDFFERHRRNFDRQMAQFHDHIAPCRSGSDMLRAFSNGKTAAFLTVENGSVFAGDLNRVALLADAGVRAVTLTWNGENEIASGHATENGFSPFGRLLVPEMERHNILIDVSHLNDRSFFELLELSAKPFLATHSNARAVTPHKRNLTDEMIAKMVRRQCLIGLNYSVYFLYTVPCSGMDALYRHIMHFFEQGAAKNLALGSDFDGTEIPDDLNSPAKIPAFYEYLLCRNISEDVIQGIFSTNAIEFFSKNLTT